MDSRRDLERAGSERAAMTRAADVLGTGTQDKVRMWVRQAQVYDGGLPGTTSEDAAEVRHLKRGNAVVAGAHPCPRTLTAATPPSRPVRTSTRGTHGSPTAGPRPRTVAPCR